MFDVNGKNYELKFNLGRIKAIESITKKSFVDECYQTSLRFPILTIEAIFSTCVKEDGSDVFLGPKKGTEVFESYLQDHGMITVYQMIEARLSEDMGFLFLNN